jgi:hypothetical protein
MHVAMAAKGLDALENVVAEACAAIVACLDETAEVPSFAERHRSASGTVRAIHFPEDFPSAATKKNCA